VEQENDMASRKYLILLEYAEGSNYSAYVPDLPGCVAAAETREECLQLMEEAIALHLKGMLEDGDPIPEPTILQADYVEIDGDRLGAVA